MTPWKMAMEAAAKVCPREADAYGCTSDYARGYEQGADAAADDVKFLPEPPEFRAAREADEEMMREARYLLSGLATLFDWRAAGCPDEASIPNFSEFEDAARALLARLEERLK